jgi:hypothetical protein
MGATVVSATSAGRTIGNDDDVDVKGPDSAGVASVAFNSFGTSPVLGAVTGGAGRVKVRTTSGSGSPAIAANNVVVTLNTTRTPRKVYLAASVATPGFHVSSVGAGTVTIGSKVAPVASTVYDFELIVVF